MTSELLRWWKDKARWFPWRFEKDRYRLFVAELLLHRTRAENVVPVYGRFIREIPDVESLSNKSVSQLEEIVGSLGLNWRVKLMIDSAKEIVNRFGGKIPCDLEKLKELPGVSDYIASAIMIFSCGCLLPLLDTNTVRITARYFGLEQSDSSRRMKDFRDGVLRLIDHRKIIDSYYALIDLGALICKPINPRCSVCPMREGCRYHKETAK